ncbi:MAG TPA: zf-HC2 domain-containing protein [Ktedonobacterales bacterium]
MTCQWVEGNLSAYLDDALDPQVREDVGSHLNDCAHCQAALDDYQRDERLLRALPTVHPDDRLRERIFDSPEFAAIARRLDPAARPTRLWRALVPAAALIALAVGSGLYIREHQVAQSGAKSHNTNTIGAPGSFTYPLAPGQRVIFLRGGALWSAPETPASAAPTASAPQQLTPTGARVVAWSVAPASEAHAGRLVAWVDGATGALHLVRADGLTDVIVTQVAPAGQALPHAALSGLVWSPDGARLAFVSVDATGALSVRILTVSGPDTTAAVQIGAPTPASGLASAPVWSANSQSLAWVTGGGSQSVWVARAGSVTQVAMQADPADNQATVARLGWSGGAVTWATQRDGQITGVFAAVPGAEPATRLTPAQTRYTAAALGSRGWLLAGDGALWLVSTGASDSSQVASLSGRVSQIVWSPDGKYAAIVSATGSTPTARLFLWSDGAQLSTVTATVASGMTPAWSADSRRLAYVDSGQVVIAVIHGGQSAHRASAGAVSAPASFAWSLDGGALAISDAQGVYLASADGGVFTLISSYAPSVSDLTWSTAG